MCFGLPGRDGNACISRCPLHVSPTATEARNICPIPWGVGAYFKDKSTLTAK